MTFMTLQQRIDLERGKRDPAEVVELNLDNSRSTDIEGLSDDYTSLEVLSMASVGLQNLSGMPSLPSLRNLELSNNLICDGLDVLLKCPNIEQLNLSNNKIESIESLVPLAKLSELRSLDLTGCPVNTTENYRKKVFALVPSLNYLDGLDENNEEEPVGDEVANGGLEDEADCADDDEDDGSEGVEEDDDDDDEDDEIGIEALQQSGDLEDDEDDYAPAEDEEAELDDYDDVDEDEEDDIEDIGANLSGAGVTGSRRLVSKRKHADDEQEAENGDEPRTAKHKQADSSVDVHVENGSAVDQ